MPRGKKLLPEKVYAIMASWAVTNNYTETAKALNVAVNTVKKTVLENKEKPEFAKLCIQKKHEFAEKAMELRDLAMKRLEERLTDDDSSMQIPANHLTTIIGTLYDKAALARGEETQRTTVEIKLPKEADEYAG